MTTQRYWWQNDTTWTTREGDTLRVEDLTPVHRSRILAIIARRTLPAVRSEMRWDLALTYADAYDDALAEMDRELDIVDNGTDEDILARMPLVRRLRELDAQDAAAEAAREARIAKAALERERARRRHERVAARAALAEDITALVQVAISDADRATLTAIRDQLARTLNDGSGAVSYRGRARLADLTKERRVPGYGF